MSSLRTHRCIFWIRYLKWSMFHSFLSSSSSSSSFFYYCFFFLSSFICSSLFFSLILAWVSPLYLSFSSSFFFDLYKAVRDLSISKSSSLFVFYKAFFLFSSNITLVLLLGVKVISYPLGFTGSLFNNS